MKIGSFPEIVNENVARFVAFFIMLLIIPCVLFPYTYLIVLLSLGFLLRVLYSPKYSLLARFVIHILLPVFKISDIPTSGPPKRFAQFIGLIITSMASICLMLNYMNAYYILLFLILFFASLESIFNYCFACYAFSKLMKWGIVSKDICEDCNNIHNRIHKKNKPLL